MSEGFGMSAKGILGAFKPFCISYNVAGTLSADESHCLVDISGSTLPSPSGSVVVVHGLYLNIDIGSFTGTIHIGVVKEVDGTNGTIYDWLKFNAADFTHYFDFSANPIVLDPAAAKHTKLKANAVDYTVLQNDANYTGQTEDAAHVAGAGDLVIITDYAGAVFTNIHVTLLYTVQ